jgi:hypothetical protein
MESRLTFASCRFKKGRPSLHSTYVLKQFSNSGKRGIVQMKKRLYEPVFFCPKTILEAINITGAGLKYVNYVINNQNCVKI